MNRGGGESYWCCFQLFREGIGVCLFVDIANLLYCLPYAAHGRNIPVLGHQKKKMNTTTITSSITTSRNESQRI